MLEDFHEKTLSYRAFVRHRLALHPARDPLRSESVCSGSPRGCFTGQKEKQTQKQKTKDFEGSPQPTQSKARLALISFPGTPFSAMARPPRRGDCRSPAKTKTGNLAAPRFSAFIFAVVALFSASGGTHRVRGVMAAVCVLSPVESNSPPWLIELQFPSTPMSCLWQACPRNFRDYDIRRGRFHVSVLL